MYLGYLIMICDALGIMLILIEMLTSGQHHRMVNRRRQRGNAHDGMRHQKEFHDDEIFSVGQ